MPAQIPVDRVSLKTNLEDRYLSQHAGGAFNVQKQIQSSGHMSLTVGGNASWLSSQITPAGFKVRQPLMVTEFKPASLNFLDTTGWNNLKYKA